MEYFTERNHLRSAIDRTETIDTDKYELLFECCERFYDNLAWKYPQPCDDSKALCCGTDMHKLIRALKLDIPNLIFNDRGFLTTPIRARKGYYSFLKVDDNSENDKNYDQYALIDLIEFFAYHIRDIVSKDWHSFPSHYHLTFGVSRDSFIEFRDEINRIFDRTGLLYTLTADGVVERIILNSMISDDLLDQIEMLSEQGTKQLLLEAIKRFKLPRDTDRHLAVEKIWDAFERLKTYYTDLNKRASAEKIVHEISNEQQEFIELFNCEFDALTKIGNNFCIRHHETNKIEIKDPRHYDYFFNRCLSLIVHAIPYLK